ncbi:glycosyltransferase family 4 protein [Mucilaginibacter sp. 44-25]|uniref:glycosyltransferase family 4 protein n=1 Tax=Mucilaginibacter sp. 44-25 TaxID=1895794 RepID=UPI000966A325|nr:glycosyltransferase family 4 protein [Mucilaginibacter sp. 44-25]OJW15070.1 MAG: glycosyl transferase family 1 [Mucilaginibacter sp. 44-25]
MKKLAIVITHPIQYYAPVFKLLQQRGHIAVKVFYTMGEHNVGYDHGFAQKIAWDIPLLEGYNYEWVANTASSPGSHHPAGIVNPGLIHQIKAWQPDAVLFFGWNYTSHLKAMRYFKNRIPVFFRGDSTLLNPVHPFKSFLKTLYLKWVYRHVDHAFYVGSNNKAYFKKYGLKEHQLSFAPHAIDNSRFKEDRQQEGINLREKLHIPANDFLIVYAGKFEPVKNIKLLISAFEQLNNTNVHLLLTGNGPNEDVLKVQAAKTCVSSHIHFIDFVNQTYMPVIYAAADIYCLPSVSETWGLAVNEAMACSRAVLVSDKVGCAADLVKPGINGAIFKSDDLPSLTNVLRELTRSKQQLAAYGKNSSGIIQDWNFSAIAQAIETRLLNNDKVQTTVVKPTTK